MCLNSPYPCNKTYESYSTSLNSVSVRECVCVCVGGVEKQLGNFTHDVRRKVFIVQKMKCSSRFLLHLVNLSLIVCTVSSSVSCVAYVVHWYGKPECLLCGDLDFILVYFKLYFTNIVLDSLEYEFYFSSDGI